MDSPAIVGCGTVGSSLAVRIAKEKNISCLRLFDFDRVSSSCDSGVYPFIKEEKALNKVEVTRFLCLRSNPRMNVHICNDPIDDPILQSCFVIDCRDNKAKPINAKIRISLDGYLLYVDSLVKNNNIYYSRYVMPRNKDYIDKAMEILINYLNKEEYHYNNFILFNVKNDDRIVMRSGGSR
jgi:hypothetical protein